MTMPTKMPISTVESGPKPNSLEPDPRAQDEHDAELGEQRPDEPRRLEGGLSRMELQEKRGEDQDQDEGARPP
jgi:hypothetical protein